MNDHLIEEIVVEVRSVVGGCDTSLKEKIMKAIKRDRTVKECVTYEEHGVLKIYVPESL